MAIRPLSQFPLIIVKNICFSETTRKFNTKTITVTNKMTSFLDAKEKYLNMDLEEKRKGYACKKDYVEVTKLTPWPLYFTENNAEPVSETEEKCSVDTEVNGKVYLWQGDITKLEIDSIVNAANSSLLGGGGVDGAIHRAAGNNLFDECETLNGCPAGMAKITGGYKLPAKYVIHTVGPQGEKPEVLRSCYKTSLSLMLENNLKSIAFPCIATGIYGYPNASAADVALRTVREFLDENKDKVDHIVFTTFLPIDVDVYEKLLQKYFPIQ